MFFRLIFVFIFIPSMGFSSVENQLNDKHGYTDRLIDSKFEIGTEIGMPSLINLKLGLWNPASIPFAFRISGGYFSSRMYGVGAQSMWTYDQNGSFHQHLGLSFAFWDWGELWDGLASLGGEPNNSLGGADFFIAPGYGFIVWDIVSVDLGIAVNFSRYESVALIPLVKVGLGYRF